MQPADTYVCCYGRDANGELGAGAHSRADATADRTPQGSRLPLPSPVRAISAGLYHSLAVTAAGELFSWGAGSGGQLGMNKKDLTTPFGESAGAHVGRPKCVTGCGPAVVSASGGRNHSLVATHSGALFSWGRAASGQLGHGVTTSAGATRRVTDADLAEPRQLTAEAGSAGLPRFGAVAVGEHFSLGLSVSGEVHSWGCEANGQLGRPSSRAAPPSTPRPLPRTVFGGTPRLSGLGLT
jgi:alpha-tubulin suppressor-like RCC1 family protein